jgi:hypothetical protein
VLSYLWDLTATPAVQFCPICGTSPPPQQYSFILSVVPYHHLSSTLFSQLQYLTATPEAQFFPAVLPYRHLISAMLFFQTYRYLYNAPFLVAFVKFLKATNSFIISPVCLSVHIENGFLLNFLFEYFSIICRENSRLIKI